MRQIIRAKQFDEERALYNLKNADVVDCVFAGPADGESALKESRDVNVQNCSFSLRYPLWHVEKFKLDKSVMDELTRAAVWYAKGGMITDSRNIHLNRVKMKGKYSFQYIKDLVIEDCVLDTKDAFWHSENVMVINSEVKGEYLGWFSDGLTLINCKISGTQPLCRYQGEYCFR